MSPGELPLETAQELARELKASHPIHMQLDGPSAYVFLAAIQLALRHPDYPPALRDLTTQQARSLQRALSLAGPTTAATLEEGWDPNHDFEIPR